MFEYDIYAYGLQVRRDPVAVLTAPHTGVDSSGDYICREHACFVNRSYTFLDGFGRVREQHAVAPDGSGGRIVTATEYDDLGRAVRSSDPFFNELPAQFYHHDTSGPVSGLVNADFTAAHTYSTVEYDWASRAVGQSWMDPIETVTRTSTTGFFGNWQRNTAASGAVTDVHSDILGRMVSQVWHPDTGVGTGTPKTTLYDYVTTVDGGSIVTITDAEANETVFVSDMAGRRTELTDPNSGTTTYEYDITGQVTAIDSAAGRTEMTYDTLGRLVERRTFEDHAATVESSWATFEFDPTGHIGAMWKETAGTVIDGQTLTTTKEITAFDVLHRPLETTVTLPTHSWLGDLTGYEYVSEVTYDAYGRVASTTLPGVGGLDEHELVTDRNLFGMATSLTVDDGTSVTTVVGGITVDALGRITERRYGNGVNRNLVWGRDSSLEQALVTYVDPYETEFTNVVVQWDEYLRETTGRVGAVIHHMDDTAMCYTYDTFNRLAAAHTAADVTGLNDCGSAPELVTDTDWIVGAAPYAASWDYSPAGHMTNQTIFSVIDSVVSMDEQVFTYADTNHPHAVTQIAGDQTNTYAYDTAGRLTTRTLDTVSMTLEWDAASNLVTTIEDGVTVRYLYDASGQRIARITGTTATAYLGSTEITDTDTTVTGGVEAIRYVSFGGTSVAIITNDDTWLTFGDIQGSATVAMTYDLDPVNRQIQRNYYAPYGTIRIGEFTSSERGWLNQTLDTATGLQYLNARYYDPTTARFISPDPLLNPGDPRMLDAYMYANNNPITFTDKTGLCSQALALSAAKSGNWNFMQSCTAAPAKVEQVRKQAVKNKAIGDAKKSGNGKPLKAPQSIYDTYQVQIDPLGMETWRPPMGIQWAEKLLKGESSSVEVTWSEGRMLDSFYNRNPFQFQHLNSLMNRAWDESARLYPDMSPGNTKRDAFRHAFWMALWTQELGAETALEYGAHHEAVPHSNSLETAMDLYNNAQGSAIARDNMNASFEELSGLVYNAVEEGGMVVIGPGDSLFWTHAPLTERYNDSGTRERPHGVSPLDIVQISMGSG